MLTTGFFDSRINDVVFVLILCTSYNWAKELTEIEALSSHPNHCTYEYAYDMYGAHCAGLRLNKLPNLRGGIEVRSLEQYPDKLI